MSTEEHARIIRDIYRNYPKLGSVRLLAEKCKDIAHELRSRGGGPLGKLLLQVRASHDLLELDLPGAELAELMGCGRQPAPTP